MLQSRRDFNARLLGSVMAYGLIETIFRHDLFADPAKPIIKKWMADLATLTQDLQNQKLEDLYKHVDLEELIRLIDLDRLTKDLEYPEKGAANLGIDLSNVEGLPAKLSFGKQIFACKKGRSIVPHGHDNLCTGFIILRGNWTGKHFDRVEDKDDHYLIKPTIDRTFKPGECSTDR